MLAIIVSKSKRASERTTYPTASLCESYLQQSAWSRNDNVHLRQSDALFFEITAADNLRITKNEHRERKGPSLGETYQSGGERVIAADFAQHLENLQRKLAHLIHRTHTL